MSSAIKHVTGGGSGENVEYHVQENVGWILFKTHNFYILLGYTIASSKCEFENHIMYDVVYIVVFLNFNVK